MIAMPTTSRIGLFGGTFDPIHFGHLECAQRAMDVAELAEVLFMPCATPHFKQDQKVASPRDRLAMCRLACMGNPAFSVSDLEVRRGGVTYTIDTIRELRDMLPRTTRISFILGTDAFLSVAEWRGSDELASLADFIVVARPGDPLGQASDYAREHSIEMTPVTCPALDISSSYIRDLIGHGLSARYLTPQSVIAYIKRKRLYLQHALRKPLAGEASEGSVRCCSDGCPIEPNPASDPVDPLDERFLAARIEELKGRVSKKRLRHILGVAETSKQLAEAYGADPDLAYLAGLLHDWDKGLDDDEIRERLVELGIADEMDPFVVESMPQVLHGPTAAYALAGEHPELPDSVLKAIYEHTTSSTSPDELSKILYIADAIEPTRTFDGVDSYREQVGVASLDDLFLDIYRFWTLALVKRGKPLHPDTVEIWNAHVG